ncbi:phosphoribosylaminoimidazole synthetase [Bacillus paralicheniformis]|uniref:phosphoribosylaminoimidazole synthetase n=1 Tax=Bacillus paralicheniformis TaxID=1648923 RepID=UPI0011BF40D3|nr:phosphoribosylaminoimidazole synthetase [Bacillus paralicheniformis]MBC8624049.1 phosphoribosylaminoimidazole synthetase [Robertmurraya crescens]MBU8699228.1 phosphoribosylaminoimidazole synthetase [Bacillus paralicheniformis]MED1175555.1 phosphoribosylaminoimidazole synthetase [Bacillus paralicheniformis]WEA72478.1 phosphoribosylaminoimidazole synthetase [Bacillus paralicheniformis]
MKVKCKMNTGLELSEKTYEIGYSPETIFDLKKEEQYSVYGICEWNSSLHFLIKGEEDNFPSWYPSELFEVTEKQLPLEWYFNLDRHNDISAVWGYKELVMDESHFDGLMERENDALKVFLERKKEIDEDFC